MKQRIMFGLVIFMCFTCLFVAAQDYYQCWTDGGGSVNGQNLGGGHYKVTWSNCGNFVCGAGWNSYSGSIGWTGSASGAQYFGVYGWTRSPLIEYYIGRGGGSAKGTYSTSKGSYTLNIDNRNGPNIEGNGPFMQYNCSGSGSSPINMAEHFSGWRSIGAQVGSANYCIVATEGWGGSSGSADVTVNNGGGGTSTTTTSSGSSTTTTSSGGSTTTTSSGGSGNITVRARGTKGGEKLEVRANGSAVATFTMSTSYADYKCNGSGTIQVAFTNDDGQSNGMDIQVDYAIIDGTTYQAENQSTNTGVYQNSQCGGSNSEWLHCNGYIQFGTGGATPAPSTTTSSGGSTTTSSGGTTTSSGGGSTCSPATSKSVPFTQDGAGEYCFSTSSNINYINSWNMATLTVNGVSFANKWASGSSLPAKVNGNYYIVYKGNYSWSHFEAR